MKKILITGGSGFIGTNLIEFLDRKKKFKIYNLDKLSRISTPERFKKIKHKHNYKFYKVDLAKKKKTFNLLKKISPDVIVHMAAESHVDRSIEEPDKFFLTNVNSTINILNYIVSLKKKIKFIHFSTDEVFGSFKTGSASENKRFETNSPYSASKASCEHLVNAYGATYGLKAIIIRLSNNYGPYQYPEKLIPNMILKLKSNKKIQLYGKGLNEREWIHVSDTCNALYKIIIEKKIYSENFNIGSGRTYKNIFIAKTLTSKMCNNKSKDLITFVTDRPGHDYRYSLNSKKFRKKFNYKAKILLNEGIEKTLKWYLENRPWLNYIKKNHTGKRLGIIKK